MNNEQRPSPFSPLCGYQHTPDPYTARSPGFLTEYELQVLDYVKSCGAAAFFQLADTNRKKEKLKKLGRLGILATHTFEGAYELNVITPGVIKSVDETLRKMAFLQLLLRMKELDIEATAKLVKPPLIGLIHYRSSLFPVVVVRDGDLTLTLPNELQTLDKAIIISERYDPVFNEINAMCRVCYDFDLINPEVPIHKLFYLKNGKREN